MKSQAEIIFNNVRLVTQQSFLPIDTFSENCKGCLSYIRQVKWNLQISHFAVVVKDIVRTPSLSPAQL